MLTIDSFPNRYIIAAVRILMIHMQLCVHGLYINYKKKQFKTLLILKYVEKRQHNVLNYVLHAESPFKLKWHVT